VTDGAADRGEGRQEACQKAVAFAATVVSRWHLAHTERRRQRMRVEFVKLAMFEATFL